MSCIFCEKQDDDILFENDLAKCFFDSFPVNKGHILIVPKAHKKDYFSLTQEELLGIHLLIHQAKNYLEKTNSAKGFNIGWNVGPVAGQTVFHAHCHLIPRYEGDVENPKGGIRNFKKSFVKY